MSAKLRMVKNFGPVAGSKPFAEDREISADRQLLVDVASVVAAKTGTLTTRTSGSAGVITLTAGHGITTGKVDIFWASGRRIGVDGTVSGNLLTLANGTGDALPSVSAAMTATPGTVIQALFETSDLAAICGLSEYQGAITLVAGSDLGHFYRPSAGISSWTNVDGTAIPFGDDDVVEVRFSNAATITRAMSLVAMLL